MQANSCVIDHFKRFGELRAQEQALLQQLEQDPQHYPAGTILCESGSNATHFFTLTEGWAGIVRHFADGRRQILDLYLPGQIMRLREMGSAHAQCDLVAFTDIVACPFPHRRISDLLSPSPRLAEALLLSLMSDQALLTERIINIARRPALERVAHFILELRYRLRAEQEAFDVPLTQELLGDLLGLSSVHVSRTLGKLRSAGLIKTDDGKISILNAEGLEQTCGFCVKYLVSPRLSPSTDT